MKTTKIVVINANSETNKRLQVMFDFKQNKTHKEFGQLWYCLNEKVGWWCWHTTGYTDQDEAILAFCKKYWRDSLVAIE